MKVIRLSLSSLHSEEWFGYTDDKWLVTHFDAETIGIKDLFFHFCPLYDIDSTTKRRTIIYI
jgi:hypothetical protein